MIKYFYRSIYQKACCLALATCFCTFSRAQFENVWVFGENAGIDFNGGSPGPITFNNSYGPIVASMEAAASVCGANGALLFYTEGTHVFDRQQNLMSNGSNLVPLATVTGVINTTTSTAQGALIVPMPGNPGKYYIFSLTSHEQGSNFGRLYYSVVDMNLNRGMGDVVTGQKGLLLDTGLTEQMSAVAGACDNIWLIVVSRTSDHVKSFEITSSGINNTPVLSPAGNLLPYTNGGGGAMAIALDRSKIAITSLNPDHGVKGLALFDFNYITGLLSNRRQLDTIGGYGVCFFPDNTKLYYNTRGRVSQFDLNAGSLSDIINSKTQLMTFMNSGSIFHMKLAPDNKIYFPAHHHTPNNYSTPYLSTINFPDSGGLACQLQVNSTMLAYGTHATVALPNVVAIPKKDTIYSFSLQKLVACDTRIGLDAADTSGFGYIWNDGFTTGSRNATVSGTYWVRYQTGCSNIHVDTFEVELLRPSRHNFTEVICESGYFDYNDTRLHTAGQYRDTFTAANGCDSVVTLDLITLPAVQHIQLSLEQRYRLCIGDTIVAEASASGTERYEWYINGLPSGSENPQPVHLSRLNNEVMVIGTSEVDCPDTVKAFITADVCCDMFVPNAFTPNGDGANDVFGGIPHRDNFQKYHMQILNRFGQTVFSSAHIHSQWDGSFNGAPAETGTYFYYITAECPDGREVIRKGDVTLIR